MPQVNIEIIRIACIIGRSASLLSMRRIIIRTERDGGNAIRACVRDFGTGLPGDLPERVFDRFFSTKREGMGIGLFIARSIVTAHGGTLHAENAEGGGAQFWLRLPTSKEIG
jgi:signal transduction histidine kinase